MVRDIGHLGVYMRIYGHISSPSLVRAPAGAFYPAKKLSLANQCPAGFFFPANCFVKVSIYSVTQKDAQHHLEPDKPILSPRSQFSTHFVKKTYFDITRCFRATRAGPLRVSNCRPKVLVRVSCA